MKALHAEQFSGYASIAHGFFMRTGGVSEEMYKSLNCGPGSKDHPDHITENRHRIALHLAKKQVPLLTCAQVHGTEVVTVTEPWDANNPPQADGMVTSQPDLILGILTADCVPILFYEPTANIIGACHAGWKGACHGIVRQTIEAILALGGTKDKILASIGPAIAQPSYEVDETFKEDFLKESENNQIWFKPGAISNKYQFDLKSYVVQKLTSSGIEHINLLANDTYLQQDTFFSFRRSTHRGEEDYGRQLSAIMLKG